MQAVSILTFKPVPRVAGVHWSKWLDTTLRLDFTKYKLLICFGQIYSLKMTCSGVPLNCLHRDSCVIKGKWFNKSSKSMYE